MVAEDNVLSRVSRIMDTQRCPAAAMICRQLSDLRLASTVGQRPVTRQHLVVIDGTIEIEVIEYRVLTCTNGG